MDATLGSVKGVTGTPMLPTTQAQPNNGAPDALPPAAHYKSQEEAKKAVMQGKPVSMSEEQWIRALEKALKQAQGPTTYLDFSVHKPTKEVMVRVINQETGEVIREIPPEKHLDLVANLMKMAGILVDTRV